jgi:hypothetical protein
MIFGITPPPAAAERMAVWWFLFRMDLCERHEGEDRSIHPARWLADHMGCAGRCCIDSSPGKSWERSLQHPRILKITDLEPSVLPTFGIDPLLCGLHTLL